MGIQALFNPQMRALNLRVRVAIDGEYVRASALEVSVLVCVVLTSGPFCCPPGRCSNVDWRFLLWGEGMVVVVVV